MKLEWRKWDTAEGPCWGLLPFGASNYSLTRVAYIYRMGSGQWTASYHYPHSSGNKHGDWVILKTVPGCKRWVEKQLASFWDPPTIIKQE